MEKKYFNILVVDDDETVRDVVTALLSREGYCVVPVNDGFEAIEQLRKKELHLVVTDLMMPGADGIEVLRYAVRRSPDIAVIMLTACNTRDAAQLAIREGARDYLTKPFEAREITLAAERAFQRAGLITDNRELKKCLLDICLDLELLKIVSTGGDPAVMTRWIERIEKLTTMNVLLNHEADVLKETLVGRLGRKQGSTR